MSNEGSGGLGGCFPGGDGALSQHPLQSQPYALISSSQEYEYVVSNSPQVRAAGNGAGETGGFGPDSDDDKGCACDVGDSTPPQGLAALIVLLGLGRLRRRRLAQTS